MQDYKHTKLPKQIPTGEVLIMFLFATVLIGGVLILNLMPMGWVR